MLHVYVVTESDPYEPASHWVSAVFFNEQDALKHMENGSNRSTSRMLMDSINGAEWRVW